MIVITIIIVWASGCNAAVLPHSTPHPHKNKIKKNATRLFWYQDHVQEAGTLRTVNSMS